MTIASAIQAKQQQVADSYTAVSNKGGTLPATQNLTNLATAISSIPSGGTPTLITKSITVNGTYNASSDNADGYSSVTVNVSGGGGGDITLTRVSDDNGNEIGTYYMDFVDGSNKSYKVIVLDAQYRSNTSTGLAWCSNSKAVTNMPLYNLNLRKWWYDNAKETATQNTQLILDYCSAGGYTSDSCSHCRSKSFVINGVTYYGQLPNMREVFDMWRRRVEIQSMDTSSNGFGDFKSTRDIWSSSQYNASNAWYLMSYGRIYGELKTSRALVTPVLEIPL